MAEWSDELEGVFLWRGDREKMLLTLHLLEPDSDRLSGDLNLEGDAAADLGVKVWPKEGTGDDVEDGSVSPVLLSELDCRSLSRWGSL